MSDNLPMTLWMWIFIAIICCVPSGVSYRELLNVALYDKSYPKSIVKMTLDEGGKKNKKVQLTVFQTVTGSFRQFVHNVFFSGLLASTIFALFFSGLVLFAFYQQGNGWYDIIMALSAVFFGMMSGLPWMFANTDDNFYFRNWLALTAATDKNFPSESHGKKDILRSKWIMIVFTVISSFSILSAAILVWIDRKDVDGWTFYVILACYFATFVLVAVITWFFWDMLYVSRSRSDASKKSSTTTSSGSSKASKTSNQDTEELLEYNEENV